MKVWDRRFQKESVSQASTHGSVLSAFLSPVTGNSILCSSKISLRIYDSSHLEKMLRFKQKFDTNPVLNDIKVIPKRTKKLKLKTSPYVSQSTFFTRADWLPRSDSAFIVSNNVQKKTIIMESNDGKQISSLNNSGGILVFQEVHPVHNMLAVSFNAFNYKSKIHLYMKEICT
nr:WD repeat-containing protein 76-like [Parasteatoda tepidariorum]